jgi:hypothetical protein
MTDATDIRRAQTQLDCCRRSGSDVNLWRGEIHITGGIIRCVAYLKIGIPRGSLGDLVAGSARWASSPVASWPRRFLCIIEIG